MSKRSSPRDCSAFVYVLYYVSQAPNFQPRAAETGEAAHSKLSARFQKVVFSCTWSIREAGGNWYGAVAVSGDWLVANLTIEMFCCGSAGARRREKAARSETQGLFGGYRLSPDSATRVWTLPLEGRWQSNKNCVAVGDYVYTRSDNRISCIQLKTGKVIAEAPAVGAGNNGNLFYANGRLFDDRDIKHGRNHFVMYDAAPDRFRMLGESWSPAHPQTSSYEVGMTHPIVDGNLYMRGRDGIHCYDLRKTSSSK